MTYEDIKVYLMMRKGLGHTAGEYRKDITAIRGLFDYVGNGAVRTCLIRYPQLKASSGSVRHLSFTSEEYDKIISGIDSALSSGGHRMIRAYSLVCLCVCCGCRPKEVRLIDVSDIDMRTWDLYIRHPKGEATYGEERSVPIPEVIQPLLRSYLVLRSERVSELGLKGTFLFPSGEGSGAPVAPNTVRMIKSAVEQDLGFEFPLGKCRRDFGQRFIDRGLDLEDTSVLMGHQSTLTTEKFYGRKKLIVAKQNAREILRTESNRSEKDIDNNDAGKGGMAPSHGIEPWTL